MPELDAPAGDAFAHAVLSVRLSSTGRHERGAEHAARALQLAEDADALGAARAAAGLAFAGWPGAHADPALRDPLTGADPVSAARAETIAMSPHLAPILTALQAEAALASGRVRLGAELVADAGPVPDILFGRPDHPFLTFWRLLVARIQAFLGEISLAATLVDDAIQRAPSPQTRRFAQACAALVGGNADRRAITRAFVSEISAEPLDPDDVLGRGSLILAAYGAVALGDTREAARLALIAGGDEALSHLRIIDRALALEMLVAAAADDQDLDSAECWLDHASRLAEHPIAAPAVARSDARVALLAGDADRALTAAERAVVDARSTGRAVEAAEAEILIARARIALDKRGPAARRLADVVATARDHGHLAVQRAAARELRTVGRRLPPAAASGLEGLSEREREVAMLVAAGFSNADLAERLYLSRHTVRIQVSRVLSAFGVATRAEVAAALGSAETSATMTAPELTVRQREVVECIVAGMPNREIARHLGVGVSTVEKHVTAVLRRWDVESRAGIVSVALASGFRAG
ncbi:LuxR C-terminal-related transcriptional regulator [uncultured Microbacterium sp.]|uniref:LuxR C-terminal-related transcriptional regulator n=1 Tax=uncultured Microbacterium sp. TaxID=191216 RepID=UPI0035CC0CF1